MYLLLVAVVSVPTRTPVIFDCRHFGMWMVAISRVVYTTLCFALLWLKEYCVLGWIGGTQFVGVGQGSRYRLG